VARTYRGDLPNGGSNNTRTTGNGISAVKTTIVETDGRNWPRGGIGSTIQNGASLPGVNAGNRSSVVFRTNRPIVVGNGSPIVAGSSSAAGSSCSYTSTLYALEAAVLADINAITAALQQANGGSAPASLQALVLQLLNDMFALNSAVAASNITFGTGFIFDLASQVANDAIAVAFQQAKGTPASASSIQQLQNDANVVSSLLSALGC
jgi:hypothetical protein